MPNVPDSPKIEQIVWFENHWPQWLASPTTFGVTSAQVTAVKQATMDARAAYGAALAARQAAKNATVAQDEAVRGMLRVGRDTVNTIKAFIEQSGNSALWGQAGLEPPAPPGAPTPPTAPFELAATLDSEGNVIVRWKTSQPSGVSGVVYSVRRSVDGGAFTLLDTVGEKMFIDSGVQLGTQSVSYVVQSKRGRLVSGNSPALTIRFGRGGPSLSIASMSSEPTSLAA